MIVVSSPFTYFLQEFDSQIDYWYPKNVILTGSKQMKKYGVEIVHRPKIKATKMLDLSSKEGELLVRKLTIKILNRHKKTFQRLADL